MLSLVGGVIGVALGFGLAFLGRWMLGFPTRGAALGGGAVAGDELRGGAAVRHLPGGARGEAGPRGGDALRVAPSPVAALTPLSRIT